MTPAYSELQKIIARTPSVLQHGYYLPIQLGDTPAVSAEKPVADPLPISAKGKPLTLNLSGLAAADGMEQIAITVRSCSRCNLCKSRNKPIPGTGSMHPLVLVIGEIPGVDEDNLGLPFVGAAGQFLDKWLEAIGLSRYTNVFITLLVRCKAPEQRSPSLEEILTCAPFVDAQIELLKPRAILTIGSQVAGYLTGHPVEMTEIRGKFFDYRGTPWMPIYHPGTVLRDPELKRPVWEDLKNFKQQFLTQADNKS